MKNHNDSNLSWDLSVCRAVKVTKDELSETAETYAELAQRFLCWWVLSKHSYEIRSLKYELSHEQERYSICCKGLDIILLCSH